MVQRTFTISHDRRREVGEPPSWVVTGACEPDPFESLNDARWFTQRETQKFSNGKLIPFKPTHAVLWQPWHTTTPRRIIPVKWIETFEHRSGIPVALYTEREWQPCTQPQWEYSTALNRVVLDGIMMGQAWFLLEYHKAIGVLGFMHAGERQDTMQLFIAPEVVGALGTTENPDTASFLGQPKLTGFVNAIESPDIADFIMELETDILIAIEDQDTAFFL